MPDEAHAGHPSRADRELAAHLENTPLAVIEWDTEFRVVRWTGQAEAVVGSLAARGLGKRPFDWRVVSVPEAAGGGRAASGPRARPRRTAPAPPSPGATRPAPPCPRIP